MAAPSPSSPSPSPPPPSPAPQRKMGTLHKMVQAAAKGELGVKWTHVLQYLDSHCRPDHTNDDYKVPFESPFPAFYIPTDELRKELDYDEETGDSILRSVLHVFTMMTSPPTLPLPTLPEGGPRTAGADTTTTTTSTSTNLRIIPPPCRVVAALCHLNIQALTAPDSMGRLPLHDACQCAVSDQLDEILLLLIKAYPLALISRDMGGRTPLHYLFWFHASSRSEDVVSAFCQKINKTKFYSLRQLQDMDKRYPLPEIPHPSSASKVPAKAAIIPDAKHGCLPLHYAIMNGASLRAINVLLSAYPLSKHWCDRYGRTALHWYLGAGYLHQYTHHHYHQQQQQSTTSGAVSMATTGMTPSLLLLHVSGEPINPNHAEPWWDHKINNYLVKMLLTSRVARTADRMGRYPLHWACSYMAHNYHYSSTPGQSLALATIKQLLDHYVGQIVCCDEKLMSPIMVFLDTTAQLQEQDWTNKKAQSSSSSPSPPNNSSSSSLLRTPPSPRKRNPHNLRNGGPPALSPPVEFLEMLLKHPDVTANVNVASLEDATGRLPLHVALEAAASPEAIELLLDYHPTALVHTSESLMVPFHAAFCREYTAPLQSTKTIALLLQSYEAGRHGTVVDGRLGLKMEDLDGYYPLHYACRNAACSQVIELLVERYPQAAMFQGPQGDLPVHLLITDDLLQIASTAPPGQEEVAWRQSEILAVSRRKMESLLPPLIADPAKLRIADSKRGLLPLHLAVLLEAVSYPVLLRMLQLYPEAATQFSTDPSFTYSGMDCHDLRQSRWSGSPDHWHHVRQLLFAFGPTLESHRHREELLKQCVRVVTDELTGHGSYHLQAGQEQDQNLPNLELTHSVSRMEAFVLNKFSSRRRVFLSTRSSNGGEGSCVEHRETKAAEGLEDHVDVVTTKQDPSSSPADLVGLKVNELSIYDEDGVRLGYEVEKGTDDDDDDDSAMSEELQGATQDDYMSDDPDDDDVPDSDQHAEETDVDYESRRYLYPTYSTSGSGQALQGTVSDDAVQASGRGRDGDGRTGMGFGSLSPQTTTERSRSTVNTLENVFDNAKRKAEEEKKDDEIVRKMQAVPQTPNNKPVPSSPLSKPGHPIPVAPRPSCMSEVGLRIWTFFVLYCDRNNPGDNYVKQVANILDEIEFDVAQELVTTSLPPFADRYLGQGPRILGENFRDSASPKIRELIHQICYFVGKYEFDSTDDILIHRSADGASVTVRAYEWVFTTEETTEASNPGISEAQIWSTGEIPAEVGATFRSRRRNVCIKFTRNEAEYSHEISTRKALGLPTEGGESRKTSGILPLLAHYTSALETGRQTDRAYTVDIVDQRFAVLNLFGRSDKDSNDKRIWLKDYPFALVYPTPLVMSLLDKVVHFGPPSLAETKEICSRVGKALKRLHEKGIRHGEVCLRNIVLYGSEEDYTSKSTTRWVLTGFRHSSSFHGRSPCLGAITSRGYARFSIPTLPPEMFAKLSPLQLKAYWKYWEAVEKRFNVRVDPAAIEPVVDLKTGAVYVVKCYFMPDDTQNGQGISEQLPPLPYELVPGNSYVADLWAFGLVLFTLSTGRPLLPLDMQDGRLLSYADIYGWTHEKAEATVFEYVTDSLAQDVLIRLISPVRQRESLESLLCRPYFDEESSSIAVIKGIIEKKRMDAAAHQRSLQRIFLEDFAESCFRDRTHTIQCWDFDLLERLLLSPSEVLRSLSSDRFRNAGPTSLVLLPYLIVCDDATSAVRLAQPDADAALAVSFGASMLALSKACQFTLIMKQVLLPSRTYAPHKFSSSDLLSVLGLSQRDYGDIQSDISKLATQHVELFRQEPVSLALMLVQQQVKDILLALDTHNRAFLYLMDEYKCLPVAHGLFPVSGDHRDSVFSNSILSMHLSMLYARGVPSGELAGFASLLALDSVPESWTAVASGLVGRRKLDEQAVVDEIGILQEALSQFHSCPHRLSDDVRHVLDFLDELDPNRERGGIHRVKIGEAVIWTTEQGVRELQACAGTLPFKEALKRKKQIEADSKQVLARLHQFDQTLLSPSSDIY